MKTVIATVIVLVIVIAVGAFTIPIKTVTTNSCISPLATIPMSCTITKYRLTFVEYRANLKLPENQVVPSAIQRGSYSEETINNF